MPRIQILAYDEDECNFYFTYTGNPTDGCGVPLQMNPLVYENIMNYGSRYCSQDFTPGQVARMWDHMAIKVSQLNMNLVGHCDFLNIDLPEENVYNGQHIEANGKITSKQILQPVNNQLNLYGADQGVTLNPGFHSKYGSSFKMIPRADGCPN